MPPRVAAAFDANALNVLQLCRLLGARRSIFRTELRYGLVRTSALDRLLQSVARRKQGAQSELRENPSYPEAVRGIELC